mgnify:CR=1 FL=1
MAAPCASSSLPLLERGTSSARPRACCATVREMKTGAFLGLRTAIYVVGDLAKAKDALKKAAELDSKDDDSRQMLKELGE